MSVQRGERFANARRHACEPSGRFSIVTVASSTPRSPPSGTSRQKSVMVVSVSVRSHVAASCAHAFTRFARFVPSENSAVQRSPPPVANVAAPTVIDCRTFFSSNETVIRFCSSAPALIASAAQASEARIAFCVCLFMAHSIANGSPPCKAKRAPA